jgi:acetylornithine deacetylase
LTDEQVLVAVEAQREWMEELLTRLVRAPTTLGREDAGQAIMADAFADCGLAPVDVPHLWTHPPYAAVREGDWLYGRGAGDMKAGLAAMTGAVQALRTAGVELRAPVQLQSVVEEECTGHGALQT